VRAPLPKRELAEHEGMLLSAGFPDEDVTSKELFFTDSIEMVADCADKVFLAAASNGALLSRGEFYWMEGSRVCAARPWVSLDERDVRMIPGLLMDAFDWAAKNKIDHLRMPLIGTGSSRHFPAAVVLAMIVRAHAQWRKQKKAPPLRVTVHLIGREALFELTSGRLNVDELVNATDLRLWVRIEGAKHLHLEPIFVNESMKLSELAKKVHLPKPETWKVRVAPSPVSDTNGEPITDRSLLDLGAISGATITFFREKQF
jgi:hypothetical protein